MQAEVQDLMSNAALKKTRRDIDKFITLNVQQISGTRQQVKTFASLHKPAAISLTQKDELVPQAPSNEASKQASVSWNRSI